MSESFNTESMEKMTDNITRALQVCLEHKQVWKTDKYEMLRIIKQDNPIFYEKYPRICRTLVNEDDITPLLGMIKTFSQVQSGKMSYQNANDMIVNTINSKYVDPVINSDKLVKEREEKKKIIELSN